MPSGLVEQENRVAAGIDGCADFLEVLGHGLRVAPGHDEPRAFAFGGTDRAEEVGPLGALIVRRARSGSASRPAPRNAILLTDPGLVLPPYFYGRADGKVRLDCFQFGRECFLKSSSTASFCR